MQEVTGSTPVFSTALTPQGVLLFINVCSKPVAVTPLHFALIGCGRIASRHAEQMMRAGKLVAVCDIIPERADALAAQYNCTAFYSVDDLFAANTSAHVAAVCTPNGLHAAHTIAALEAGMHVICEKPMAIHSADCKAMMDAATQRGKKLFVVKQNRFNPPVAALKEVVHKEMLGAILSLQLNCFWNRDAAYYKDSWKGTMAMDGGILFTQFSHFIDLLYWIFGDIKILAATTLNMAHKGVIEFEDTAVVTIQLNNGAPGSIHCTINSHKKNMEGSLTVFGEKGTVKIGGEYLNELEYQSIEDYTIENLPAGNRANEYGTYTGSMSNHDKAYKQVVEALQSTANITTNAHDAMKTVEIIENIYAAAKRGKA